MVLCWPIISGTQIAGRVLNQKQQFGDKGAEMMTQHSNLVNALILGKRVEIGPLCAMLQNTDYRITLAESTEELEIISSLRQPFKLVVMTDSFPETLCASLVSYIKQHLYPGKIICLLKSEDEEKERSLRSLGLIFLGSYQRFALFAEEIINHVLKVSDSTKNKEVVKNKVSGKTW